MDDSKIYEFVVQIKTQLAEISSKVDGIRETLSNHENRISSLEKGERKDDFKTELLKLLGKGLIIAIITIGTLCGAGGLIQQIIIK